MNLFGSILTGDFTLMQFMIVIVASLVLGFIVSLAFMFRNTYSKSFITALILIPAIETVVILLVNDNLGVGLSVAGSFALIRFRSIKGNAKELVSIFLVMSIGILCGTGYVTLGAIFTLLLCVVMVALVLVNFGKQPSSEKYLKITIPESLNYDEVFNEILRKYTNSYELISIKTLNLGSLFRIEYHISLKNNKNIKKMIDELRTRNGNLEIMCSSLASDREEL